MRVLMLGDRQSNNLDEMEGNRKRASIILLAVLGLCCSPADDEPHTPSQAIGNVDVYPGLEATLFASEPMLSNPTNLDIDLTGRIWLCDVAISSARLPRHRLFVLRTEHS